MLFKSNDHGSSAYSETYKRVGGIGLLSVGLLHLAHHDLLAVLVLVHLLLRVLLLLHHHLLLHHVGLLFFVHLLMVLILLLVHF